VLCADGHACQGERRTHAPQSRWARAQKSCPYTAAQYDSAENLKVLDYQLIARHPEFGQIYIARAYLAVAIMLGIPANEYREIADALELDVAADSGAGHA
jgi:hypothetical protein